MKQFFIFCLSVFFFQTLPAQDLSYVNYVRTSHDASKDDNKMDWWHGKFALR
jgi:hypothetical protein